MWFEDDGHVCGHTWIHGFLILERKYFTFKIACWDLKVVDYPTPKYTKLNVQGIKRISQYSMSRDHAVYLEDLFEGEQGAAEFPACWVEQLFCKQKKGFIFNRKNST